MAKRKGDAPTKTSANVLEIWRILKDTYPDAKCELDFKNPLQLTVATILSAQCTDKRVNMVTPALFKKYKNAKAFAQADREELETMIASTGFFRNKANSILGMAQKVVTEFNGEIPQRLEELITLPGVGRKTANVVLGNAFNVPGLTVDTHFGRLVRRFGWTKETDPVKVEFAIMKLMPQEHWTDLSHVLIWHGRRICHAQKPACGACPISHLCAGYGEGPTDPEVAAKLVKVAGKF